MRTDFLPLLCSCGESAIEGLELCPDCQAWAYLRRGDEEAAQNLVAREWLTEARLDFIRHEVGAYGVAVSKIQQTPVGRMGQ